MERPLALDGELDLEFAGGRALVVFEGESLALRLPDARSALALFRQLSPSTRREGLRRLGEAMRRSGLAGRVLIGDRVVARIGGTAAAGPLSRVLGVDPMALSLFELLGAALGRRRATTGDRDS